MFGALIVEQEPIQWKNFPALLVNGVQDAGGWAAVAALLGMLFVWPRLSKSDRARIPSWLYVVVVGGTAGAWLCYIIRFFLLIPEIRALFAATPTPVFYTQRSLIFQAWLLTIGGALGLIAAGLPFLIGVIRLKMRRIFAIAALSFREAVRRRVLYVFSILLLVFLFGSWFISPKPEDQVRTYVQVVFVAMTLLLLLAGGIIAAFSIPADIRSQTIHTILTKPVERFEIVLGRFLGFTALMTVVLGVMAGVSLLYIVRGVSAEAAEETLKAREPMNGELSFLNTPTEKRGDSVGREWDYRSYISAGMPGKQPTAIWSFEAPPKRVAARDTVRCEFGFDIYRTTKGVENKGVACTFRFITANHDPVEYQKYLDARPKEKKNDPEELAKAAENYGIFEYAGKDVTDFHTQYIDVPGGLFKKALAYQGRGPALRVEVQCNDQTQYVGMAKHDLYFRLDDPEGGSERVSFAWNFLKGASGVWFRLCLVIGLGVALSTYLSGVISLLITGLLYLGGVCHEFIRSVAIGTNIGGGPLESAFRLVTGKNMNAPLDKTGAVKGLETTDLAFRWAFRRVLNLLPDVDRYDLTGYVAEGFNIPLEQLLVKLLLVFLYLLPWGVLAYYLLKWREVASAT